MVRFNFCRTLAGIEIDIRRCYFACKEYESRMRTTLVLDDDLVARAQEFTGVREKTLLVREALKALIQRESARRLARLGGTEPGLKVAPRRRPKAR